MKISITKKLLGVVLALAASFAFGATTVPVGLLNSGGSTSGWGIVSSGPTTPPRWGAINAATLNGATFASPGAIGSGTPIRCGGAPTMGYNGF